MSPHGQGSSAHMGAAQLQSQGKDFCPTGKRDGAGGQSPLWSIPWGPLAQGAPAVSPLWHLLPKLGPGQQPHRDPRGQCPRGEVGPWLRAPQLCAPQLRVPISADAPVHQEGTAWWHNLPEGALAAHTCLQGQIRAIPGLTPLAATGSGATLGGLAPGHATWGGSCSPMSPARWHGGTWHRAWPLSQPDTWAQRGARGTNGGSQWPKGSGISGIWQQGTGCGGRHPVPGWVPPALAPPRDAVTSQQRPFPPTGSGNRQIRAKSQLGRAPGRELG